MWYLRAYMITSILEKDISYIDIINSTNCRRTEQTEQLCMVVLGICTNRSLFIANSIAPNTQLFVCKLLHCKCFHGLLSYGSNIETGIASKNKFEEGSKHLKLQN